MPRPSLSKLLKPNIKSTKVDKKRQTFFGPSSKTCPVCHMTYSMSESDIKLHKKHHSNFTNGIHWNLKGDFFQILSQDMKYTIIKVSKGTCIENKKIQEILEIVDESLGSLLDSHENYHKFFILVNSKVEGVLLTECIEFGHRVIEKVDDNHSEILMCGSVYFNPEKIKCSLGIYKIWVSESSRRQGIASKLLDEALQNLRVKKDDIAFSQPSEYGRKLAINYCRRMDFLIY